MSHFILTPNPPMDTDGRREDTGRGVRKLQKRWSGLDSGRREVGGGLQALLGAPMAAYSGCGEGDGGIGHGKRRSRTGLARVGGDVGSVADGRRQAGSGMARSRARARLNWVSQGQRCGRCRVRRLLNLQRQLSRLSLLIIDELGFVPLSPTGAELLFEVFSQRYERGSTMVTTNLPFDEWTEV